MESRNKLDLVTMPFPRLSCPLRIVLWATLAAAAIGAAYSEMQVLQRGGQALDLYGMARGAVTGALIAVILTTFDAFVLNAPLGSRFAVRHSRSMS